MGGLFEETPFGYVAAAAAKYEELSEKERIDNHRSAVRSLVSDCQWHTAEEIRQVGGSEGLRRFREIRAELRKSGWAADKKIIGCGLYSYRLIAPDGELFR